MGLRILIASDHYPPFIGGAHRQTQLLAHELLQRGHEVRVATVWHVGMPDQEDDAGVPVHRFKQIRTAVPWLARDTRQRHQPPFPDPVTVWGLRRLIDRFQPDIVHSHGWFCYSCAAALLGKQIPLLITARDYAYGCPTRSLVFRSEQLCSGPAPRKCLECAGQLYGAPKGWAAVAGVSLSGPLLKRKMMGIHSISSYVQQMIRRDFVRKPAQPAPAGQAPLIEVVIPSFAEDESTIAEQPTTSIDRYIEQLPKQPFILFVGALRLVKGLAQLLEAYERLVDPPTLVLIGTIEADTPQVFPPGVVVLQDFPHRAVMAAWERCIFGVIPSLWPEPLGSVVYEAMSKGKAVIGTTPGGHTDMIVDRETGLLVPVGDVDALTQAMRELIDNIELRERLGRAAREPAKLFTASFAVPRFEQAYLQLVEESRRVNERSSLPLRQR